MVFNKSKYYIKWVSQTKDYCAKVYYNFIDKEQAEGFFEVLKTASPVKENEKITIYLYYKKGQLIKKYDVAK